MKTRRFIFVSWEYPPAFGGGIGTYVASITRSLASEGHRVEVVTVTDGPVPSRETIETIGRPIEIVRLPIPSPPCAAGDPVNTLAVWQRRADQVRECLLGMIREGPIDAIEFADYRGEGFSFLNTVPARDRPLCIVRLHTPLAVLNRYNTGRRSAGVLEAFENDAMIAADLLVSPSRALAEEVRQGVGPLRDRHIAIHPYPFDSAFAGDEPAKASDDSTQVLYVGRLEERKGVQCLIEASHDFLRGCPDATLRLVGGDTALSACEPSMLAVLKRNLAADLADRVDFNPSMPREALVSHYRSSRLCVFPSLFENFPNVCLEAMSLGRPVIGTSNSGMAEMIEHGRSGVIVPSGDPRALARAMTELFNASADARTAMGEAARRRVRRLYDPPEITRTFIELCGDRTGDRSAGGDRNRTATVGVVIPCYNHGQFVQEVLDSIFAQTHPVREIVIVDDGSPDASTRIRLEQLAAEHASRGVRLIRQPNAGLAAARNTGVRALSTDFYVPLDADDQLDPAFVERLLPPLLEHPTLGYAYSWVRYFGANDGHWHCPRYDPVRLLTENMSVATALVRRRAFDAAGGYNPAMVHGFEDWDFWLSLLDHGWHGTLVPVPLFLYRKHAQASMLARTQERRDLMISQMVRHHEYLYAHLVRHAVTEKDRLFFREHMDHYRLRESLANAGGHSTPPPSLDRPGASSDDIELADIERSLAWRAIVTLKANPLYDSYARRRYGDAWRLAELKETSAQRLARIRSSRSFRIIESIKGSSVYRAFSLLRRGDR